MRRFIVVLLILASCSFGLKRLARGETLDTKHHPLSSYASIEVFLGNPNNDGIFLAEVGPLDVQGTINAIIDLDESGNGTLNVHFAHLRVADMIGELVDLGAIGTIVADLEGITFDLNMYVPVTNYAFNLDDSAWFQLTLVDGIARLYDPTGLAEFLLPDGFQRDFGTSPSWVGLSDILGLGIEGTVDDGLGLFSPNAEINLPIGGIAVLAYDFGEIAIYYRYQGSVHVAVPEAPTGVLAAIGLLGLLGSRVLRRRIRTL